MNSPVMPQNLAQLIQDHGESVAVGSNRPFILDDTATLWWVEEGGVDVFVVALADGNSPGVRTHLLRLESGQALLGLPPGASHGLMAVGAFSTRLRRVGPDFVRHRLADPATQPEMLGLLHAWLLLLSRSLSRDLPPKEFLPLTSGSSTELVPLQSARPTESIVWIRCETGSACYNGRPDLRIEAGSGWWPVTDDVWLAAEENCSLICQGTAELLRQEEPWEYLRRFHALALRWAVRNLAEGDRTESMRLAAKGAARRQTMSSAVKDLAGVLGEAGPRATVPDDTPDPTLAACHLVGQALGVSFRAHPDLKKGRPVKDPLGKIAAASRLRLRRVVLADRWWQQDNGPLLGYLKEDDRPVALLPSSSSSYGVADPADGSRRILTPEIAEQIKPVAFTFYRPLPNRPLKVWEVVRFGLQNCERDLGTIVLMGLAGGLLGILTPVATGVIFDRIIPGAERMPLFHITGGLLVAAIAGVMFQITRSIALLRVETRSDAGIQGAVWDRLLSLPLPFFRDFTAGDLAMRANGINAIRQMMSDALVTLTLGGLSAGFNFALLFFYSVPLAFVSIGLVAVNVVATLGASLLHLKFSTPIHQLQGRISGMVLQFITGISKLRVAGAEGNAFAVWARNYAAEKQFDWKAATVGNAFSVFDTVFPTITTMVLFAGMAHLMTNGMSTGDFLAFNAAFGGFLGAMLALSSSVLAVFDAIPIYNRARPILEALPEIDEAKADPGDLSGRIELNSIRFRYRRDGPLILHDLSFAIEPGEFVAIVGPSGSGKSTLMRLLLGFEQPEGGTLYYDGMDLANLDVQAVRRQFGVVLQNGKLMPGSIFENIVGSSPLTLEDAWSAAEQAGFADDVEKMPMGMHTVLSEGAGTLSGGQRQRLMIARAIVARPRILLFDEATSALDNHTQAIVSESLEHLQATRIVIAHRLSTIMNADRILVVQAGRLVQSGSFQELVDQPGLFADLAKRQLA